MRITEKEGFTLSSIVKAVASIMRDAHKNVIQINVWASTPCTSGCPGRHVNNALGRNTSDEKLKSTMSQHAIRLCKLAPVFGGHYIWEWPERCELLQDRRVRALAPTAGNFGIILASAVDWCAIENNKQVTIRKLWTIWTTDDRVAEAFHPYLIDSHSGRKKFVECSGNIAKQSTHYTKTFVDILWGSQRGSRLINHGASFANHCNAVRAYRRSRSSCDWGFGGGHCELDSRSTMRIWFSFII